MAHKPLRSCNAKQKAFRSLPSMLILFIFLIERSKLILTRYIPLKSTLINHQFYKYLTMKKVSILFTLVILFFATTFVNAQCNSSKSNRHHVSKMTTSTVVDVAISSDVHTTLVAAVKAADLVNTLQSGGPFTVFAPTNTAFNKLPEGTVTTLLKPENKQQLTQILTYHVVPARLDATTIVASINASGGSFTMKTVSGGTLTAMLMNGSVVLKDENGGKSFVTTADLMADNGVVHVVDAVVLPK